MSKKLLTGLCAVSLMLLATQVRANGTPMPEIHDHVDISGAVDVVTVYQHDDQDAGVTGTGGAFGVATDYGAGNAANADHFRFVINEVEVDLEKTFGENIRLRADIDFSDLADTGQRVGDVMDLEQAYVTANLAAGNGIEFLIGKFNAPVGVQVTDTRDNWLISYAPPYKFMTPAHLTGAKLYYAFSDLIDLHFAVVNDLNANGFGDSAIPSALFRLGFNWGDYGSENTIGISGGVGPEQDTARTGASHNAHLDFFGDLDLLIAATDTISIAAEGVYRQTNAIAGGANQKAIAGFAALNYEASDVWDISARIGYMWEINPLGARGTSGASTTGGTWGGTGVAAVGTTGDGYLINGGIGVGYLITDEAKLKLEGNYDWFNSAAAGGNVDTYGVAAQFAYTF